LELTNKLPEGRSAAKTEKLKAIEVKSVIIVFIHLNLKSDQICLPIINSNAMPVCQKYFQENVKGIFVPSPTC
jgi:hypothetical protein